MPYIASFVVTRGFMLKSTAQRQGYQATGNEQLTTNYRQKTADTYYPLLICLGVLL
jgi:hypothetical protein